MLKRNQGKYVRMTGVELQTAQIALKFNRFLQRFFPEKFSTSNFATSPKPSLV